jgi:hypothetical protein
MAETAGQRKVIGATWLLVAILSIAAAFLLQPVSDWGIFTVVLAILVALLGITGAWMLATGKGRIYSTNTSLKGRRIVALVGLIGSTVLVLSYLVGDWANWTAQDALTIGIWLALGVMFAEGLVMTRKDS